MKEIELTQGKVALVDDEDYEDLMQHKWCARYDGGYNWYAERGRRKSEGRGARTIRMHRAVLKPADWQEVDHVNRNGLDNRRSNLRIASKAQNRANARRRKDSTSGYKGVSFDKSSGMWRARIGRGGGQYIGRFDTPIEAAAAYNEAALEYYGEFAGINEL